MSELKTTSLSHKDNNTGTPNITMYPDGTTSLSGVGGKVVGYQQGVWVPSLTVGTATTTSGTWIRVGNHITIDAAVTGFSDSTSASAVEVGSLPYLRVTAFSSSNACRTRYINFDNYVTAAVNSNSYVRFYSINTGDVARTLAYADVVTGDKNNAQFMFSASYLTDDTTWVPLNGATVT